MHLFVILFKPPGYALAPISPLNRALLVIIIIILYEKYKYISSRRITHFWVCQSALYANIGNDDDICLACGRLLGVTSRVLIAGVESTLQGLLLCHLKLKTNLASAGIELGPQICDQTLRHSA